MSSVDSKTTVPRTVPLSILRPSTPQQPFTIDISPESLRKADRMRKPDPHWVPPLMLKGESVEFPRSLAQEILDAGDNLNSFQAYSIAAALQSWCYARGQTEPK